MPKASINALHFGQIALSSVFFVILRGNLDFLDKMILSCEEKWGNLRFVVAGCSANNTKSIMYRMKYIFTFALMVVALAAMAQNNVAEEVAWVVGDQPIFKSEIEEEYQQAIYERAELPGNPYCLIPERMAIDKLFLHQARIDTIEVPFRLQDFLPQE